MGCNEFVNEPTFIWLLLQPCQIVVINSEGHGLLSSLSFGRICLAYAFLLFFFLFHDVLLFIGWGLRPILVLNEVMRIAGMPAVLLTALNQCSVA